MTSSSATRCWRATTSTGQTASKTWSRWAATRWRRPFARVLHPLGAHRGDGLSAPLAWSVWDLVQPIAALLTARVPSFMHGQFRGYSADYIAPPTLAKIRHDRHSTCTHPALPQSVLRPNACMQPPVDCHNTVGTPEEYRRRNVSPTAGQGPVHLSVSKTSARARLFDTQICRKISSLTLRGVEPPRLRALLGRTG